MQNKEKGNINFTDGSGLVVRGEPKVVFPGYVNIVGKGKVDLTADFSGIKPEDHEMVLNFLMRRLGY